MRTIALALAAFLGLPAPVRAQLAVDIHLDLPAVLPRPVVVQPGVQVVPEVQEEVYLYNGWYYARRDGAWYRSHDHRRGWVVVPGPRVPQRLAAIPPGHYRNWKREHEMEKAERKADKRREKEARREEREERRDDHDHGNGNGNGNGHGHGHDD